MGSWVINRACEKTLGRQGRSNDDKVYRRFTFRPSVHMYTGKKPIVSVGRVRSAWFSHKAEAVLAVLVEQNTIT